MHINFTKLFYWYEEQEFIDASTIPLFSQMPGFASPVQLQEHPFIVRLIHALETANEVPTYNTMEIWDWPKRRKTNRKWGFVFSFWTNSKTTFGTVERCWKKVVECFYMFLLSLKSRGLFFEVHAICIRDFTPGAWPNFSNVPPIASQSASGPWSWSIVPVATSNKSFCRDTQWSVTIHSNPIWFSGKWRNKNIFIYKQFF